MAFAWKAQVPKKMCPKSLYQHHSPNSKPLLRPGPLTEIFLKLPGYVSILLCNCSPSATLVHRPSCSVTPERTAVLLEISCYCRLLSSSL